MKYESGWRLLYRLIRALAALMCSIGFVWNWWVGDIIGMVGYGILSLGFDISFMREKLEGK